MCVAELTVWKADSSVAERPEVNRDSKELKTSYAVTHSIGDLPMAISRKEFPTPKRTIASTEHYVETWYDPQSRNYITELKDDIGQVGDASYSGDRDGAKCDHERFINIILNDEVKEHERVW